MIPPVLIVEDTPTLQALYGGILKKGDFSSAVAPTAAEARDLYRDLKPRVVLMDLGLPDGDGVDLIRELLASEHQARFVVVTADGSVDRAVESMRAGADEFLVKPFDDAQLLSAVRNAVQAAPEQRHFRRGEEPAAPPVSSFIGSSRAIRKVYETIEAVSRSMAPVLITGESGTGKEICAQAVHATSARSGGPFVPINCAAISADRLETEVLGQSRGSGSSGGAVALAHGGTLFFDDIGEMDLSLQTKILRILETSHVTPSGAPGPSMVDVRIVAATSRDPEELVAEGRLREDLFYRLHVVPIHLPPLRERNGDVLEIADAMLARFNAKEGRNFRGLSEEVKTVFRRYEWPGNVRQLGNVLWNIVLLNDAPVVTVDMLPQSMLAAAGRGTDGGHGHVGNPAAPTALEALTLAEAERWLIERAIDRAGGSVPRAARALDVSASTIYRKRAAWQGG